MDAPNPYAKDEEEGVTKDKAHLSASGLQLFIKTKAFSMLGITFLLVFSDPMVPDLQEMVRMGDPPFCVSFVLAPLDRNSSEVLANLYNTSNKTSTSITNSFAVLKGAAAMNNTLCPSIFIMGLIYFRGLVWQCTT